MSLQLALDRETFTAGEWVTGTVFVHNHVPARTLAVHVVLREKTRSYEEDGLSGWTGPLHQGPIPARSSFPFSLQLPLDVPPPYSSPWGELYWEVDAKADISGGVDAHARRRILVLPPGVSAETLVHPGAVKPAGVVPGSIAALGEAAGVTDAPDLSPTASSAPGSFPAGWHADPWLEKRLRWWDGNAWTGHTAD